MRHVLRFVFFAILLALATSAHAQQYGADCSEADQPLKTWNEQPPNSSCPAGTSGPVKFGVYSTTVDQCVNLNNNNTYAGPIVRQVLAHGVWHCFASTPSSNYKCGPRIEQEVTHATSGSDFNRFYLRYWDADISNLGYCATYAIMTDQDFWQCNGVACPTCPHPTCACDPNTPDPCCCGGSPILIDIGGQGFDLTNAQNGVRFDISGKGNRFQIGWTAPGANNAFLCLPDTTGGCNSGKQLFGNFTPQPSTSTPNGFAALAVYDQPANGGNGDGIIDSHDAVFSSLRLWIDANHDGVSQPNEIYTLPSLGVYSISLAYKADQRTDQYGNVFRYRAQVNPGGAPGTGRMAYDVFLTIQSGGNTITAKSCPAAQPPRLLPEGKDGRLK